MSRRARDPVDIGTRSNDGIHASGTAVHIVGADEEHALSSGVTLPYLGVQLLVIHREVRSRGSGIRAPDARPMAHSEAVGIAFHVNQLAPVQMMYLVDEVESAVSQIACE